MADWFIATEGVKVVKDSASLWPQIITAVSSIGAAMGAVVLTHHFTHKREERAAAAKRDSERLYIATELVFLLERFAQHCASAATATIEYDQDGKGEAEFCLPKIDYSSVSGDWRSLPPELMYRISELSVLSHEAFRAVNTTFHEDTPYGGAGEFALHDEAARMGIKALRLSRRMRMLCNLPQNGVSADLSPTRVICMKVNSHQFAKRYRQTKNFKKNEQIIDAYN